MAVLEKEIERLRASQTPTLAVAACEKELQGLYGRVEALKQQRLEDAAKLEKAEKDATQSKRRIKEHQKEQERLKKRIQD